MEIFRLHKKQLKVRHFTHMQNCKHIHTQIQHKISRNYAFAQGKSDRKAIKFIPEFTQLISMLIIILRKLYEGRRKKVESIELVIRCFVFLVGFKWASCCLLAIHLTRIFQAHQY